MKRLPWIHARKKTDPELPYEPPILLGNISNGEFFREQTAADRKLRKAILAACDEKARYLGMDRRDFIASTMGMATTLSVINLATGCSDDANGNASDGSGGSGEGGLDGGYQIPADATVDADAADEVLGGKEFILDLQTHHIEDEEHWRETHPGRPYSGAALAPFLTFYNCPELMTDPVSCVGPDRYVDAIFLGSATTVAVLSGFPGAICDDATLCNHPISNIDMANSRDRINAAAGSQRMVQHCQVMPEDRWELQAEMMERIHSTYGNHGWKLYPPSGGWWLDDPQIAYPFYEKALALGQPLACVHKGIRIGNFIDEYLDPKDVGPAATAWPDIRFVIYHSAIDISVPEGPYDEKAPAEELTGVNRLIRTVLDHDLSGKNVYAEMGTAWFVSMNNTTAAQHYIGKILKYLGEDRLVWGSECVWFNSPQPQIEAFRTFQISKEFQDRYGYPEITPNIRAKVFGLNGAALYGIDPKEARYAVDTGKLASLKQGLDGELGGRRWMFQPPGGPRTRREFLNLWRWRNFTGSPA